MASMVFSIFNPNRGSLFLNVNIMDEKKLEDMSKEALIEIVKSLQAKRDELVEENIELRKFVEYVRSLKTHADFNRLRNIVTATNKKFN